MKVAIVGCAHGELDTIYFTANKLQNEQNIKIDLLICCGDFQATRNESDLRCMAVPEKFYNMGSFYKYYSGEKVAPILTIFIGGNHEASNYLQELPYGGWVAPKIYYMGYAGVIKVGNLRIGGISGIFKPFDYMKGHFERTPYNKDTKRSVYHVRNVEVFKLKQISGTVDIMLSHDWPRGIYNYGSIETLLKNKPFFEKEVNENKLGSEPCEELLFRMKPKYWFSAHLHTKFSALVQHNNTDDCDSTDTKSTSFLALDKCLPRRKYFEIIDIPDCESEPADMNISYDLEWLTILHLTDHLMSTKRNMQYMPGQGSNERWSFTPTAEEMDFVFQRMEKDLSIPLNFEKTAPVYNPFYKGRYSNSFRGHFGQPKPFLNPQTVLLCKKLGIKDPIEMLSENYAMSRTPENCPVARTSENYPVARTPETSFNESAEREDSFSFVNSTCSTANNTLNSEDNSFSSRPSISTDIIASTPIAKKIRIEFPDLKDKPEEESSSDLLPFCIDRSGSTDKTTSEEKKVFKRRNAQMYEDSEN